MKNAWTIISLLVPLVSNFLFGQSINKIVLDSKDSLSGYYLALEPHDSIKGVLVLLPGFGEYPENIFPESKLFNVAYANNILTIVWAEGNKLYADSIVQIKLTTVLKDVIKKYRVNKGNFVLGGYSAGGMVALRYAELCNEIINKFPIQPQGVFTVDSPIDIFTIWNDLETSAKNKYSPIAIEEAERAMKLIKADHGVPKENTLFYSKVSAFSMDKNFGENEKWLKNVAVRTYHEVDVAWRLINRNQTVSESNYLVTSELINRLLLLGNTKAEFIQSDRKGYRSNGARHPHSWSIIDEVECIQWIKKLWR